ncbi:MAG: ester cyclase [Chloroflexi bacterium]|nr:ester cyclase [Chloroflexota bacterium]
MSTEQNKAIARRYIEELWNQNNLAVIDEIIAPDLVGHAGAQTFRGADTLRQRAKNLRAIYSDVRFTLEDQIAEADKALLRWTFRARHTGEYMGAKPTGKEVVATGMNLFRLANGKIAEIWVESDDLGELQQLGIVTLPK